MRIVSMLPRRAKQAFIIVLDVILVPVALILAFALQKNALPSPDSLSQSWMATAILMTIAGLLCSVMGIHKVQLKAYETRAFGMTVVHALVVGAVALLLDRLAGFGSPTAHSIIFALVYLGICAGSRFVLLQVLRWVYRSSGKQVRVVIYGAGRTGKQLAAALNTDDTILPVAFVDDNASMQSTIVQGLRVYSPVAISSLVKEKRVDRVLLAMPSLSRARLAQISARLEDMGLNVESLPSFAQLAGNGARLVEQLRPVSPGDFLGREPVDGELTTGAENYIGKSILITGAGGSIGSELCRQLIAAKPRRLVLFELSELALYNIDQELAVLGRRHGVEIVPCLGSVRDAPVVRKVIEDNAVEIVLHAAAYKHVPIVERDPVPGFANNVIGTQVVAQAALDAGVGRFMLISTDKAVRPKNMMGASKRLAELVIQDMASRSNPKQGGTCFSMVRFGNVIGSSGSVIPLFEEQIARGGPVTLTHRDVTRYFMTIPEAARLVLVAGTFAHGGDVFVLDMGDPVSIYDLARQMITAANYTVRDEDHPNGDIEIVLTGLRPGEKLEEELLIGTGQTTTPHPKILQAQESRLSEIEVAACLRALRTAVDTADNHAIRGIVGRWIEGNQIEGLPREFGLSDKSEQA